MWLDRTIRWFLPREEIFYSLLERGAGFAKSASSLLVQCCNTTSRAERETIVRQLKEVEGAADRSIVEVYKELSRTFITPIDRSDIYALATELEKITDDIFATALQCVLHAIEELPAGSIELARLIERSTGEIYDAVVALRSKNTHLEIRKRCKSINNIEGEGDAIFRAQIAAMFQTETNAIRLMKNKEFLEGLEHTLDACDDVGNVLSTIVIKNS